MSKPTVLIISTLDTKLDETLYLRDQIVSSGTCAALILDVGRLPNNKNIPSSVKDEIVPVPDHKEPLTSLQRSAYITTMVNHCIPAVTDLVSTGKISGIVSAGGSCNSSLATALMRACCPIGFPKLQVSTMASGDIKPYIQETDITMMYSVVDIAGVNSILKRILSNAAGAIVGMATAYTKPLDTISTNGHKSASKKIAVSMFGVTTPCVDHIRRMLHAAPHDPEDFEIYVFHATGAGGLAMERLISDGLIDAVVDITTTEVADELFGGVLTAGASRLEAAAKRGIPVVLSVGACDMVNFGPRDSVPDKFEDRNLYLHNSAVTLMRTTKDENIQIGNFIVSKLIQSANPGLVRVLLPLGGLSVLDAPGQAFHDPDADAALFETIETGLFGTEITVERHPGNINEEIFAAEVVSNVLELTGIDPRKYRLSNQRRRKWSFDHGASMRKLSVG